MKGKYAILLLLGVAATAAGIVIYRKHKTQIMNLLDKTKLALVGRTINKIIVHCTATRPSQACTVELIDQWHRERGFDCIGYHYVIYRDGSVHEGRALSKVGAHCTGQNSDSIGISYCGGVALWWCSRRRQNAAGQPYRCTKGITSSTHQRTPSSIRQHTSLRASGLRQQSMPVV